MKKMNKVAAAVLAVAMVGSMAVPAFAATVSENATGADYTGAEGSEVSNDRYTTVTYEVREGYTWTIHTGIDFSADDKAGKGLGQEIKSENNKVSVSDSTLKEGNVLQITAKGNSGALSAANADGTAFEIKNRNLDDNAVGNKTLKYDVKSSANSQSGGAINPNGTVLVVEPGAKEGSTNMTFTLHTDSESTSLKAETAGKYQGYITYTANIVKASTVTDFTAAN